MLVNYNYNQENKDRNLSYNEILDYLKKFEDIEKEEKINEKKFNNKIRGIKNEKDELENKCNMFNEQIKEEEIKNKNLISQIEEQKIAINDLQEKMNALYKNVEKKRKIYEAKDEKNKNYIQKLKRQNSNKK